MSFFNMFKEKLDVIYDSSKDTYTCIGRYAMPVFINRAGRNNTDRLFIKMTRNEFTFKRVFLYEVVELLKKAISNPNHRSYAKNMVYMLNELQRLEDERLAMHSHKVLNYDLISKVIKHKPFDYQLEFFKYYDEYKSKTDYRGILLDAAAGSGKALDARTRIKVPGGWKKLEDIKVGDLVMAQDGTHTKVTGVFPQGYRQLYKITFADGRFVYSDIEHRWSLIARNLHIDDPLFDKTTSVIRTSSGRIDKRCMVGTTGDLYKLFTNKNSKDRMLSNRISVWIPLCEPEKNKDKDFIIHPYIMGVILGDGGLTNGGITLHVSDLSVIERVRSFLLPGYILKVREEKGRCWRCNITNEKNVHDNVYIKELKRYELYGKPSYEKWIPKEYFDGSPKQRWDLLNGLMDTDGWVDIGCGRNGNKIKHDGTQPSGNIQYGTSSEKLAKTVALLVYSMGDICKISQKIPTYTYKNQKLIGRTFYRLSIRSKNPRMYFTRVAKRLERLTETTQYSEQLKLRIVNVEKLNITMPTICIAVDHPSKLYVVEDYIVTHNTNIGLSISVGLESDYTVIICPLPTLEKVWIHSLTEDCFKQPQQYWTSKSPGVYNNEKYIVVHYEAIDKLYDVVGKINNQRITVIVDEVHSFAAEKSKRTVLLNDILNLSKSQDIILMSGTPVKSYTTEIINIVRFIDGNITAKDFDVLKYMYGNPNKFFRSILPNKYKAISYKIEKKETKLEPFDTTYVPITLKNSERYTLPFIKEEMKKYVERRITEIDEMMPTVIDVYNQCLTMALDNGYPSKNMDRYKVLVSQIQDAYKKKTLGLIPQVLLEANKLENEIAKYLPIEYKKQFIEFKTIIKYPMLKIQGECLGRVILRARIDCHIDIAANLQYDEFIESTVKDSILFSNYVEVCNAARLKTMSMGYQPVCVYGENVKGLNASLKVFSENKKANPLITTYKALSTGVPLTNANVIIALDLPFRMYVFEQAVARAWRVGQDSKVVVFIPTLDTGDVPNINQRNFDIITFFNSVVEEITGYKNAINIKETKDLEGLSLESYNNKVMGLDMDSFFHIFKYDMSLKETVDNSFKLKYLEW